MATVKLWSTEEGKLVDFEVDVDQNGEFVATYKDEMLKFPGGLTTAQFKKLVDRHNKANKGIVAIPPEELEEQEKRLEKSRKVLEDLDS